MTHSIIRGIDKTLGIVGGGQLGRMLTFAARRLGCDVVILDPQPNSPAGQVANAQIVGGLRDAKALQLLADRADVLTVEIEHVDTETLETLAAAGKPIYPAPRVVSLIQDKLRQKEVLAAVGLPVAPFRASATPKEYPAVLKARFNAYDGRGNLTVSTADELPAAIAQLGGLADALYVESIVPFERELTVMVACGQDGTIRSYPPVQTFHRDHILRVVVAPAHGAEAAVTLAERAVAALDTAGIFGVELFGLPNGEFLINEIAPRPHNAGHFSIEACVTSQFEQHVRAVLGLPLGDPSMIVPAAVMINLLGDDSGGTDPDYAEVLRTVGASAHWYAKTESRPRRKMGHVTFTGATLADVLARARTLAEIPYDTRPPLSVGIIMGSDSDLPTMRQAATTLEELGIGCELTIVSAHRTPDRMVEYARSAAGRGLRVIIAGAGGAAHLPGMVAAMTPLPVIGVPIRTETLNGLDSLYSIVQMPRGVPVATVAIGNAVNAGLLAARILGTSDTAIQERLERYRADMEQTTLDKVRALESGGEP
ncbi:MAG: 5-(carboxyamino)imidazole ribonucleotide synthase [Aggregatilineales bacterium]